MKNIFMFVVCVALTAGCQDRPAERVYNEVIIKPEGMTPALAMNPHVGMEPMPGMSNAPAPRSPVQWTVPDGWEEVRGGGMRIVSFRNRQDPQAIDVSIVSLSGPAGGLEANLIRWGGQIGIDLQSDPTKLKSLMSAAETLKTSDGSSAQIYDFRSVHKNEDPSGKNIVAAMTVVGDSTIFVKMTGSEQAIESNLASFKALTQSLGQK